MKTQLFTNIAAVGFLILMAATFAFAQVQPKTVTDFYLALPGGCCNVLGDDYLFREPENIKGKNALTEYRKSLITIADIKNGYLRLEGVEVGDGWVEIALFKKTDGAYIVALSQVTNADSLQGEIIFLTFNNGKWTDVTQQYAPKLPAKAVSEDLEAYWKLPRVGKTLIFVNTNENIKEESEKLVHKEFKFEWNGAKFVRN